MSSEMIKPLCIGCNRRPEEIEEYIEAGQNFEMTPDDYVRQEEGTYNRENGHFLCTVCYVDAGCPTSGSSTYSWIAP